MHILAINPNSTESMTVAIGEVARAASGPGTRVTALNPPGGPAAIQGEEDGEAALPGLLELFAAEMNGPVRYDAVIIACFDDTGLGTLKSLSLVPVIGIGEAAFHMAMLLGHRFSVVTTLAVSVPVIERNLLRYGFADRCAKVRATGIPVLDLEAEKDLAAHSIAAEIERAVEQDRCDAVLLGCAGMADLAPAMTRRFRLPVIDGVAGAVALCESLHRTGLSNARTALEGAARHDAVGDPPG